MHGLTLAVNTCFAGKHWPQPAAWLDLVCAWGVEAVQFSLDLLDPDMADALVLASEVRAAAQDRGVRILSTFTGAKAYATNMLLHPDARYRAWAKGWLSRAIAITAALGAPATGGHLGAFAADGGHGRGALLAEMVDQAVALGREAEDAGLHYMMLELMPGDGEVPGCPDQALELLRRINAASPVPYYLCYDLGHACGPDVAADMSAGVVYSWLERLAPVTRCLHLQQTDGRGDRHWPFTPRYADEGIIDPRLVLRTLDAADSRQPAVDLVLELAHPPEAAPEAARADWGRSVAVWQEALREALREARAEHRSGEATVG